MRRPSPVWAILALLLALTFAGRADAAIYYRSATVVENGSGASSMVLATPSGVALGDLMIADVDAAGTGAVTPPAGWTSIFTGAGFATYSTLHYRVATAADVTGTNYTWNLNSSRKATGRMWSYVGADSTTIGAAALNGNSSGTTITFNSVTTAVANSLVVLGGMAYNAATTVSLTPPGAATSRIAVATSGAGSQLRSWNGDFIKATAGATGNLTGTIAPSSNWGTAMFAVRPLAGVLAFEVAPNAVNMPAVTLNGQAQTTSTQMSAFAVVDTTGSGSGWNITSAGDGSGGKSAVLKQYCTNAGGCGAHPFGYVAGGYTLPAGSLKLNSTGASFTGATGTAPTFQCGAPCSLDSAAATKVASAAAGAGLGPWQTAGLSGTSLSLSTPSTLRTLLANEVYRVDLLWTLSSGP